MGVSVAEAPTIPDCRHTGAAHEAASACARLLACENDLEEHRFVELNQSSSGPEQVSKFFAQDADDVLGQHFARSVGSIRQALHPQRARQQVKPAQRNFHRPVGKRSHVLEFVQCERPLLWR